MPAMNKQHPSARRNFRLLVLIGFCLTAALIGYVLQSPEQPPTLAEVQQRQEALQNSLWLGLGRKLAQAHPGAKMRLLVDVGVSPARLQELQRGLAGQTIDIHAFAPATWEGSGSFDSYARSVSSEGKPYTIFGAVRPLKNLQYQYPEEALCLALRQPGATVVINLLPFAALGDGVREELAGLGGQAGISLYGSDESMAQVDFLLQSQMAGVLLLENPGRSLENYGEADRDFDNRIILVNRQNLAAQKKQHPCLAVIAPEAAPE